MHRVYNALLFILLGIFLIHFLIYLAFGIALIPFPFDYDQAEGYELNNAVLMANGQCPYCDNDIFPFYGSGYPPFFHILMIPFVWLFGPQFWYGRLLIFLSTLTTSAAIGWAVWRAEKHQWVAIIAGLGFVASNYIYHIGPLLRQHLLMVMFETLAIVLIANCFNFDKVKKRRKLLLGFTLLLLAGYTKQLAYSTCIAVFLWVFLRNPRTAIKYSVGLIIVAASVFMIGMLSTDGGWWINLISANQNPYIPEQFTGLFRQFTRLHWTLLLMSMLMLGYELFFSRLSLYSIWFVVSLVSTVGAGKWGAGDSYFATTLAASCILSGIFVARSVKNNWHFPKHNPYARKFRNLNSRLGHHGLALTGIGLFAIYGFTVFKIPTEGPIFSNIATTLNIEPLPSWRYPLYDPAGWTVGYAVTGHLPTSQDYEQGWQIVDYIETSDALLMSEDAGFSFRSGREVITNGVQLKNLWENGLYDPTNLIHMISNHEFGLIIVRAWLFPPPVNEAIQTFYEQGEVITMNGFAYELWQPKEKAPD